MSPSARSPNTRTLAEVEKALAALSEEANGEGQAFRSVSGGRHGFVAARSKTHEWGLARWGAELAERCGCRVKLMGFGTDEELAQGHLDADTWALDEAGLPMPFAGSAFDELPGALHVPKGWAARAAALGWSASAEPEDPAPDAQAALGARAEAFLRGLARSEGALPETLREALERALGG